MTSHVPRRSARLRSVCILLLAAACLLTACSCGGGHPVGRVDPLSPVEMQNWRTESGGAADTANGSNEGGSGIDGHDLSPLSIDLDGDGHPELVYWSPEVGVTVHRGGTREASAPLRWQPSEGIRVGHLLPLNSRRQVLALCSFRQETRAFLLSLQSDGRGIESHPFPYPTDLDGHVTASTVGDRLYFVSDSLAVGIVDLDDPAPVPRITALRGLPSRYTTCWQATYGDVDDDGADELVVAVTPESGYPTALAVFSTADMALESLYQLDHLALISSGTLAARDVDDDGVVELIFVLRQIGDNKKEGLDRLAVWSLDRPLPEVWLLSPATDLEWTDARLTYAAADGALYVAAAETAITAGGLHRPRETIVVKYAVRDGTLVATATACHPRVELHISGLADYDGDGNPELALWDRWGKRAVFLAP